MFGDNMRNFYPPQANVISEDESIRTFELYKLNALMVNLKPWNTTVSPDNTGLILSQPPDFGPTLIYPTLGKRVLFGERLHVIGRH